jgi:hypothetical protein
VHREKAHDKVELGGSELIFLKNAIGMTRKYTLFAWRLDSQSLNCFAHR